MPNSATARAFTALLVCYLLLAAGFALRVPAWLAPDEPAHYNYAAAIAHEGCCPVIAPGDWDQAYLAALTARDFAPDLLDRLPEVRYENHQPPLYYLFAGAVYALSDEALIALRLLSVVFGAGTVVLTFAVARHMLPDRPAVWLASAAFVAFVPQHLHILGSVNNDSLAGLVIALTLWRLLVWLTTDTPPVTASPWALGVLVGVGLLTKLSAIFLAGLIPLMIVLSGWTRRASWRDVAGWLLAFTVPMMLIGGVWAVRNISVYGFPDVFGLRAHDLVVVGQPRTMDAIAALGMGEYLRQLATTTFHSFWGKFGWMELTLPTWAYVGIGIFAGAGALGCVIGMHRPSSPARALAWAALGMTIALALAQYGYYNLEYQQFQGRYLYPALIPLGLLTAAGIDVLWRAALRLARIDAPIAAYGSVVAAFGLGALSLFALWRVLPGLTG
jgi:4-amino-4-deoxy-L-arabinose transferase-like glycosyltransferase